MTALVLVAHGTADPRGRQTVIALRSQVARLLPGVRVLDAYVDVQRPRLPDVVDALVRQGDRTVIVPTLLSTGYHIEVDVARAAAVSPLVTAAPPLGPHPVLAQILGDRLDAAGATRSAPVVLAAAGSSRPEAADAVREVAADLQARRTGRVVAGFAAAASPSVREAVDGAVHDAAGRRAGDAADGVWLASYLLGHGFFHSMLSRIGPPVTEPLGADPRIASLVRDRFLACLATPAERAAARRPASVA